MFTKSLKSQTMLFSYALVIMGVISTNLPLMQNIIPEQYYGIIVTVIGILVAMLRLTTTKPLKDL